MFAYPPAAAFHRPVPKTKIYAHARASKRLKEMFVAQIGEIVWRYKLAPETINLPARRGINEIQVFELVLKTPDLDETVLAAIDRAIPFPLLFQLTHDGRVQFAASYKRPSAADASKWVLEALFVTPPQVAAAELKPLPVALDLASLYEQLVRPHIPLPPRAGENLADHVARFQRLEAKQKLQRQLSARLAQEKQFNRKVELNAALRSLKQELVSLNRL